MRKTLKISAGLLAFLVTNPIPAWAGGDCTAPAKVRDLATLIAQTFNGERIHCDDGSSFSTKYEFECRGEVYQTLLSADKKTVRPDGTEVYVASQIKSDQDKGLQLLELVYNSFEKYENGAAPDHTLETKFLSLSERSFSFYSSQAPKASSWISSIWFIPEGETKAKGYKLYAGSVVSCQ